MKALFIILPLVVLLACVVLLIYSIYKRSEEGDGGVIGIVLSSVFAFASVMVLLFVPASIHQVEAGEVAVVKVWGDAQYTRSAGLHFDLWISHKYEIYDSKVQQTTVTTQTYSQDGQTMDIELVIQYQIQQDKAMEIAKSYGGLAMLESRIETVAIERMKSVLSQKSAMKIIETRSDVSRDVTEAVTNAIKDDYYANITTVVLTDISFSDAFEKTVEDKMIAEQEKLKAEYEKEKAIIQAEQELEVAKLEAQARLAKAKGDADSQKVIADAEAYATQIKIVELARSFGYEITEKAIMGEDDKGNEIQVGTQYIIEWEDDDAGKALIMDYLKYLEFLSTWNGKMPDVVAGDNLSILFPTQP